MSKFEGIKGHLSSNFDKLNDVLQIELRAEFLVIEDESQSYIIISIQPEDNTFTIAINGINTVINYFDDTKIFRISNAKMIGFIPIDGKNGLLGFGDSHCDFVFFDENDFCFVEFKLNATSLKKIEKNRNKAIEQVGNTIDLFNKKLSKNYQGLNLEAYICTPEFYPKLNASWIALAQDFLETYGIQLFEKNNKNCK